MKNASAHLTARTPSAPVDVLLSATDLYVRHERHSKSERDVFEVLALNLLKETSDAARLRIANLLADHKDAPEAVLRALARDADTKIAAIALRRLNETAPSALPVAGNDDLEGAEPPLAYEEPVSANFSDEAESEHVSTLEEDLAATALRGSFVDHFADGLTRDKVETSELLITRYVDLPDDMRREAIAAAELMVLIQMTSGGYKSPMPVFKDSARAKLFHAAMGGQTSILVEELSYLLGLARDISTKIVVEDTGEAFAICLKALDMPKMLASQVLIRIFGHQNDIAKMRDVIALFSNVSQNAAKVLVKGWITGKVNYPSQESLRQTSANLAAETSAARSTTANQVVATEEEKQATAAKALAETVSQVTSQMAAQTAADQGATAVASESTASARDTAHHQPQYQESTQYQESARAPRRSGQRKTSVWDEIREIEELLKIG